MPFAIPISISRRIIIPGAALLLASGMCAAGEHSHAKPQREPDVIYVPTPQAVVEAMLKMANISAADTVYDLGCGDGRLVITAAKMFGAHGVGVDINPERIAEAIDNAKAAGVSNRVKFIEGDMFQTDIHHASVVTLYLLTSLNLRLRPKLWSDLKPGSRVVSHAFDMGEWKPEREESVNGRRVFLWTIPDKPPNLK
ncbi:MAG: class I SAM-dependent methyltransferase [Bryobacterales bacterium]|nr:class I SAM-dependent methyltransferase [Bryobacterales bacterium]